MRSTDVIARLGGDEFAILLPGANEQAAYAVATELREALAREADAPKGIRRITASIGVAPFRDVADLACEDVLIEADIAMYDAKEAGRDRAAVYNDARDRHRRLGAGRRRGSSSTPSRSFR